MIVLPACAVGLSRCNSRIKTVDAPVPVLNPAADGKETADPPFAHPKIKPVPAEVISSLSSDISRTNRAIDQEDCMAPGGNRLASHKEHWDRLGQVGKVRHSGQYRNHVATYGLWSIKVSS